MLGLAAVYLFLVLPREPAGPQQLPLGPEALYPYKDTVAPFLRRFSNFVHS